MLKKIVELIHRGRWPVLVVAITLTIVCSIFGPGVFSAVKTAGSFSVPGSESSETADDIGERFPESDYDVIAVLSFPDGQSAESSESRNTVERFVGDLPMDDISVVADPWDSATVEGRDNSGSDPESRFISSDGDQAVVAMKMAGASPQEKQDDFLSMAEDTHLSGASVEYAGSVPTEAEIGEQTSKDVSAAETWSMPILSVLLIIVFGSLVSSLLPVLIAGAATMGAFAALRVVAGITDVSVFAITITTILALVLAVDYGLIIVSRYREELASGFEGTEALYRTVRSAGETVLVSALLVAVSLSVLLLFPQNFLKSMAYGGVSTLAVALLFALVVLPACLAIAGPRINALRVPGRRLKTSAKDAKSEVEGGLLHRLATSVMRRPIPVILTVLVALAIIAAPALGLRLGSVDHRVLPPSAGVHQAAEDINTNFPGIDQQPVTVLVEGVSNPPQDYINAVEKVDGIDTVEVMGVAEDSVYMQAHLSNDWQSAESETAVADIRAIEPPSDAHSSSVGGMTAEMVDQIDAIYDVAPIAIGLLALFIFVVLLIAFKSVLLPLKAIFMNLLSLSAAFGVMVLIFQDGVGSGILGFSATGTLDPSNLILVFCLLFGLSMDYEVFMLSRIKEAYDETGDNQHAVALGLQRTAGIITAAAALLLVVVGAFSFAGISFIKMIGIGMLVAITIDVLLIRTLLVPATMRLLGSYNWWPGNKRRAMK